MKSIHDLLVSAAEAIDTVTLPGRKEFMPGHAVALLVLNNVRETSSVGGGSNSNTES